MKSQTEKIAKIEEVFIDSYRYDIEVEDNHNFFANDILVHNCQNLKRQIMESIESGERFEVTVKMDGSSFSALKDLDGTVHVCSRNLSKNLEYGDNAFINLATKYDLIKKLEDEDRLIQISGEMCGPGIQNNRDALPENDLFVFDIFDIKSASYMRPKERMEIVKRYGLKHVPVLYENVSLKEIGINSLEDMIKFADGVGYNSKIREGVVFKSHDRDFSFKSISNLYLLKFET